MKIRIKILPSTKNEWLGWFGDEVIKVKLRVTSYELRVEDLIFFLEKDLGIREKDVKILKVEGRFVTIELPDVAWELFLSAIE